MTYQKWLGFCEESGETVSIVRTERSHKDVVGFSSFLVGSITVRLEQNDNPHTATGHKVFLKVKNYSSRPRNTSDILPMIFIENDWKVLVDRYVKMGFRVLETTFD